MATGKIPAWARQFLGPEDCIKISEAVACAERRTSGEIVPMVVRRSCAVGQTQPLLASLFLLCVLLVDVPSWRVFEGLDYDWALLLLALLSFTGSWFLSRWSRVQRFLIPWRDQASQVDARALLEFYHTGVPATAGRTGILIFLSLMERRAVVLADEAISKKLSKETWGEICQQMVSGISSGRTAEGICAAIERSGELLAKEFPLSSPNDTNELSNQLIIKE